MNYGYAVLLSLGTLAWSSTAFSQGEGTSFIWKFEEGNKLMEEKLYNQAAEIWMELLTTDPENANLNYKLGLCYFSSYNQKAKAQPFLEKASQLRKSDSYGGFNSAGYDPFEPKERNAPVEVDYYLARSYHLTEKFDLADPCLLYTSRCV